MLDEQSKINIKDYEVVIDMIAGVINSGDNEETRKKLLELTIRMLMTKVILGTKHAK